MSAETTISLSERAYQRLLRAMREGESFSDVMLRLTSTKLAGLQKRGEKEIVTSDGRILLVRIDQDRCLGAESCVLMAPTVFALDESNLGMRRKGTEPLGMMDVLEGTVSSDTIVLAAKSCPYRAILVKEKGSEEDIVGP